VDGAARPLPFHELDFRNAIIFARTVSSRTPLNGFMLLLGTTASGFVMNLSSLASSHVIPELFKLWVTQI
jgi:hypothetical protein